MNKVLLTGASGFLGSAVAKELWRHDYSVSVLLNRGSTWRLNMDGWKQAFDCYEVNLCNEEKLSKIVEKINPDIIYHFAANIASSSADSAEDDFQTNIIGTWNLLRALSCCDYKLFVNAGSSSEYGFKNIPMSEFDILNPNSYHSFSKGTQTNLVQTYGLVEKHPVITLRFFSVYGPYERKNRLIPSVIDACLNKKELKLSSPDVVRDFIYIDDVVNICTDVDKLIKHTGQIFNIGTGTQTTIRKVVNIVSRLTNYSPICLWGQDKRSWDHSRWVSNCEKTIKILGWKYSVDIATGLENTIEWVRNYQRKDTL